MGASFSAEWFKLRKRPSTWVVVAVWLALDQVFGYLIPYAGYLTGSTPDSGEVSSAQLLAGTLPAHLVANSIGGFPVFGGALAVVLGALAVGSEYGWGTLKTTLTQRPGRLQMHTGKLAALGVLLLGVVLATFALGALTSGLIGLVQGAPTSWPPAVDLAEGIAAGCLITLMWALFGVVLAILFRSVALPIGLGIIWVLAIENLITVIAAPLLPFFRHAAQGAARGERRLARRRLGRRHSGRHPGVNSAVAGTQATLVLVAYAVVFAAVSAFALRRRDVA